MRMTFEVGELPPEGNTAQWQRLVRRSAGVRPVLQRAGWTCTKPYDGVDPTELWQGPNGERQVLVMHEPWRLPDDDQLPEPGSAEWMKLVARSHRERSRMHSSPGWRCVYRRPADSPIERWRHVSGVEARLALWTRSMWRPVDPGVPPPPMRVDQRFRSSWESPSEGHRWFGSVDSVWR